jgi:O-acetylserine/cysteine efflux transporter
MALTPKTIFLILFVLIIWASNFVAIKWGVAEIPPLMLLTLRFALAGLLFLPFIKWPGRKKAVTIAVVGILMGPLHQGFLYVALQTVPAGTMAIILQTSVILVTLLGWLFLKERVGWRTWTGIGLGISGIVVLLGMPSAMISPFGYFLSFASAFFLALNYLGMKKIGDVRPATYICLLSLPSVPLLLISSLLIEGADWISNANALRWDIIISVVVYQAVILSASHMLWQNLVAKHPVSQIVPWTLLIPLLAVAIGAIFLNEAITLPVLAGGALTILGVTIITFRRLEKGRV